MLRSSWLALVGHLEARERPLEPCQLLLMANPERLQGLAVFPGEVQFLVLKPRALHSQPPIELGPPLRLRGEGALGESAGLDRGVEAPL